MGTYILLVNSTDQGAKGVREIPNRQQASRDTAAKLSAARAAKQPIPAFPDIPFDRQVRIVMDHLKRLVEAAGSNMDCLLKVIVWLKDQRQQEEFDRIYRSYFTSQETLPARTRMQAGRTPFDCGLEIEAIGYVP